MQCFVSEIYTELDIGEVQNVLESVHFITRKNCYKICQVLIVEDWRYFLKKFLQVLEKLY